MSWDEQKRLIGKEEVGRCMEESQKEEKQDAGREDRARVR